MSLGQPFNFKTWIDDHRHLLKPPVGNQVVWEDAEFIIMVVGGPNNRDDFHINQSEEFFYQLEGNVTLRVVENGKFKNFPLNEGEIFLLPPKVPHSPQRPANTVGLVVERKRREGELDGFRWYCDDCASVLWEKFVPMTHIVTQLPQIFQEFYSNSSYTTCKKCGTKKEKRRPI
ncbi:MAG: 3-hydroxyanthranilate 3,4-dioxygenase [Oligoflexales bacterium]